MVFLILFLDGKGDFLDLLLLREVFLFEKVKYFIWFVEKIDNG